MHSWIIPVADGHTYYLSGTLTIPQNQGDHLMMDWHGVLELPHVLIPKE
jgi:hypothetical protein